MITQTLDLNLIPGRVLPMVNVSQYDKDSRTLEFTIYNGDQTFDLTGLSAYIQGLKPDGHGFNYSATIADGKVTANVEEQMTVVAGRVMCEIILMDGTDRAGTGNFILNVEAAAMPDGSNMSDSEYSYIEQLIEDAQEAQTEAEESAEDAEAWAVGKRNGVPVGPTDPTYHNNSHYWSQQAAANDMTGATATTPGVHGLVPAPAAGDQDKYLKGDGTWGAISGGGHTIQNPSGTDMTQRSTLQFTGSGVTVSDDAINDKTVVGITAGGLLPHLVITSEAGATITITKDGTTISATETSSGTFEVDVPDFGTWTIIMNYGGDTYNQNVTIDTVKIYTTTILAFTATILVTYPSGAICTCTGEGQSYTASGTPYTFIVSSAGTYTITVTMDGASKTASVTITSDGQSAAETIKFGTINLTVDNDFVGETISCVNGGTTITKTASSTSVTFRPPTTGTWTISGTVNGTTYTTTATVSDLDTPVSASLQTVPDGKTVTPTDDVQTWLACAGITDKAYTTIEEVLADSTTLLALISDNNAVDYLVRCKTWTGKALVPTMTSNTVPSGECFGSGAYSAARDFFYAFDNNASTYWAANVNGIGSYIAYDFTEETVINKAIGYGGDSFKFEIEYSEDKTTWLSTGAVISFDASQGEKEVSFSSQKARYWRAKFIDPSAGLGQISSLQFYSPNLCDNSTFMTDVGANNYAADTLLADSDWLAAICASTYFESVLNTKVPTMTGNDTPSGECYSENVLPSQPTWYAFDNNGSTFCTDSETSKVSVYGYIFTSQVKVCLVSVITRNSYNASNTHVIRASNDGNNFDELVSNMPMSASNTEYKYIIESPAKYTHYDVKKTSTGYNGDGFNTIQFYGRADV